MKKLIPPIRRFQVKVTLVLILAMILVLLTSNLMIYQTLMKDQFKAIRYQLMIIAQIAALQVDADKLLAIPLNKEGIYSPAYKDIDVQLNKIKQVNPQIRYIYIMFKTNRPGTTQFVVDADTIPERVTALDHITRGNPKNPLSFPGDFYDATRFPEMLKAFDGPAADTRLGQDEWGKLMSGYAPIRNTKGEAVALIGVDIMADKVAAILNSYQKPTLIVFLLGLLLSFLLGMFIAKPISRPIEELAEGTRRLAKGDLLYRATVHGEDEIKELAESFNQMARNLYKSRRRLVGYFTGVVKSLVRVLEARDHYTRGHSQSVASIAGKIALRMGLPRADVKTFKKMAVLHDIGKVGVCDSILNKTSKLTDEEWKQIKEHPVLGEKILKPVLKEETMLDVVRNHHERYDGGGYPDGLRGDNLSIYAAIAGVADAWHAMTSDRSYRKALSKDEAIAELKKHRGTQFHPKVVDTWLEILEKGHTT